MFVFAYISPFTAIGMLIISTVIRLIPVLLIVYILKKLINYVCSLEIL